MSLKEVIGYYESGNVHFHYFENELARITGSYFEYFENGNIKCYINYENSKINGIYISYCLSGEISDCVVYRNGERINNIDEQKKFLINLRFKKTNNNGV